MIRQAFHILLTLALLAGCSKEEPEGPRLRVSTPRAVLPGTAQSTVRITVRANERWRAVSDCPHYAIAPSSGSFGQTTLTLTALEENSGSTSRELEPLTLRLADGTSETVIVTQRPAIAPRALFFFFIGTSLQSFFDSNLEHTLGAMNASLPGDGRVAAFCLRNGVWQIAELHYDHATQQGAFTTLAEYGSIDRNGSKFIAQVLGEMKSRVPASEYGIVFGGHGTGWLPAGCSVYGPSAFMRLPSAAIHDSYPVTRYFGENGSMFDIPEIAEGLADSGTQYDYVIFDDCFMSNIETLYTLRDNARYIVASPCEIMGEGFPYGYVVPALFDPERPLQERLQRVCEGFYTFYRDEYDPVYASGCIALTACGELEALAQAARQVFATGSETCDPAQLQAYEGLPRHLFYDLRQYAEQIATDDAALRRFQAQFDNAFPAACRLHTDEFYSWYSRPDMIPITYYSGVTCSAPSSLYNDENRLTDWWRATH